jgi:hypothetical protein
MQAKRWGSELLTEDVVRVDTSVRPFVVESEELTVRAHTIIMATGATARRLGIPSEKEFWSRGISACAICDGASPLFKGQEVAVVGGGALQPCCMCCAARFLAHKWQTQARFQPPDILKHSISTLFSILGVDFREVWVS